MINSIYSTDTCQIVLHLNHTNQNQVQHLTWHYEMLLKSADDEHRNLKTFDLFVQRKLRAVEPTVSYEPYQVIEA
ncbi:unnamed protein product [Adineta steineri]|uniref:Uncharacterized protein n=1 Tax=Adineta steineri TaxID=433720 RepID=A0A814RD19_9BILA|nr:unnamed protein product [Adineta steineri]CAF1270704.1 unnamed protein product [Adineta steineri]CAF4077391.1 unnamed protein product [Adineta steineri]CAF4108275.1 unnamed protein product [Adineta steineri]